MDKPKCSKPEDEEFTARPYQDKILEIALKKNTIIYLPTGSGKTFIAEMAIKRMASDLELPLKEGGKRTVFLTNTVALARQQYESIRKICGLKTSLYTGDMNVDAWREEKWLTEFNDNQVIVATCQIVLDVIRHNYFKMQQINLMIFDECHNGTGNHCMRQLMNLYGSAGSSENPRVIGLTGSLLDEHVESKTVLKNLYDLELTYRATITTVGSTHEFQNVLLFSTNPDEQIICYTDANPTTRINQLITMIITKCTEKITKWPIDLEKQKREYKLKAELIKMSKYLKKLFTDFLFDFNSLGLYGASLAIMSLIIDLELKKRSCNTQRERQIVRLLITTAEYIRHIIIDEIGDDHDVDTILTNSTEKVVKLLIFLKNNYQNDLDGKQKKGLVFVQRRQTAKNLNHIIRHYVSNFNNADDNQLPIYSDFMVGNNSKLVESIDAILENKWNSEVLERFRRNETNLIFATSVLEEGVDFQMCNLVIKYDDIVGFRSYVQSKGRARMKNAKFVIMTQQKKFYDLQVKLIEYNKIQTILKSALVEKAIDRYEIISDNIDQMTANKLVPPYRTPNGAILEVLSALPLINQYCGILPCDKFSKNTVLWTKELADTRFKVSLIMPIQSSIKQVIVSDLMPTLKMAQRAAAFKACVILFENGELNDHLLPITFRRLSNIQSRHFNHWKLDKFKNDLPRLAGTNELFRTHNLAYPKTLTNCTPTDVTQNCYVHAITIIPDFTPSSSSSKTQFSNEYIHKILSNEKTFGIFTTKPLPKLAEMKFFNEFGDGNIIVTIGPPNIVQLDNVIDLNVKLTDKSNDTDTNNCKNKEKSLSYLRKFHMRIFTDLLQTDQTFLSYDYNNENNSYFIVPIIGGGGDIDIDWSIVWNNYPNLINLNQMESICLPAEPKRRKLEINPDDFRDAVIFPLYRANAEQRYVVTKIHEHLSPASPFPSDAHDSYATYFQETYNINVMNLNQFMIEVKPLPMELNQLVQQERKPFNSQRGLEFLIPELCYNFQFPVVYWLKSTLLPSILHRLHYLLIANELRVNINEYLVKHSNTVKLLNEKYNPWPIIDKQKKRTTNIDALIDDSGNEQPNKLTKSIVIPNPEDIPVIQVPASDLISLNSNIEFPWNNLEEPTDFTRHLETVFPLEIDYYFNFINDKLNNMTVGKNEDTSSSSSNNKGIIPMICDSSDENKQQIELLINYKRENYDKELRGPEQCDLLASLTSPFAADIFDNECLSFLGNSFVRLGCAVYLLKQYPKYNLNILNEFLNKLSGSCNLAYLTMANLNNIDNLPGMIKLYPFIPKNDWIPPLLSVPQIIQTHLLDTNTSANSLYQLNLTKTEKLIGTANEETILHFFSNILNNLSYLSDNNSTQEKQNYQQNHQDSAMKHFLSKQRVDDKTIADTMLAIYGSLVKSIGIDRSFIMLGFFGILPEQQINQNSLETLLSAPFPTEYQPRLNATITNNQIDKLIMNRKLLQEKLGYTFTDRAYLLQALTHTTFPNHLLTNSNQSLTFLGQHLLNALITAYIFERCTHLHAGQMNDLRDSLIADATLAGTCVRHGIYFSILYQNVRLAEKIENFVKFFEQQQQPSQKLSGITDKATTLNNQILLLFDEKDAKMGEYVEVPQLLSDVCTAIIGAIFLDCQRNVSQTWQIIYQLMKPEIETAMGRLPMNTIQQLKEYPGANIKFDDPHEEDDFVMVNVRFTKKDKIMQTQGFGKTKQEAKLAAAKVALHKLIT